METQLTNENLCKSASGELYRFLASITLSLSHIIFASPLNTFPLSPSIPLTPFRSIPWWYSSCHLSTAFIMIQAWVCVHSHFWDWDRLHCRHTSYYFKFECATLAKGLFFTQSPIYFPPGFLLEMLNVTIIGSIRWLGCTVFQEALTERQREWSSGLSVFLGSSGFVYEPVTFCQSWVVVGNTGQLTARGTGCPITKYSEYSLSCFGGMSWGMMWMVESDPVFFF